MKRFIKVFSASIAAAAILTACGTDNAGENDEDLQDDLATESDSGGDDPGSDDPESDDPGNVGDSTLRMGMHTGLITFDPHMAQAGWQPPYLEPVYDTLLRRDEDLTLTPGLATEWGYPEGDGLIFEMEIRDDVVFHDGELLTATVVKDNLDRGRSLDGPQTSHLSAIEEVTVTGDHSLRIDLSEPDPTFALNLSSPMGMIISPAELDGDRIDSHPIGSGPWEFSQEESSDTLHVYLRNDDYWDPSVQGAARIEMIELEDDNARLNALLSEQIDITIIMPEQVAQAEAEGFEIATTPDRQRMLTIFDRDGELVPELGDVRVRQAMNFAVDRQAIIDAVYFGIGRPGTQVFPPGSMAHNPEAEEVYEYDPDRARELLGEAGVEGFSVEVAILPYHSPFAEAVQAYFAEVGIDLQLAVQEPGTLARENRSGAWAMGTQGVGAQHPHLEAEQHFLPDAATNPFGTTDQQVVELVEAAAAFDITEEERSEIYQELSMRIVEEAWFVATHYTDSLNAYNPARVSEPMMIFREPVASVLGLEVLD